MTQEEIYKLYRKTEYDSPKLLQVLADVCSITITELKQIIKDGDEKSMPKGTRWTDEQHAIYDRMTAENAKAADIAEAMGVPVKAIHSRKSNDKAKLNSVHEPKGKPATVNKNFDELFDGNDTYTDCAPDNIPDLETGEDVSGINAKIRDLCETPDPITTLQYGIDFGSKSGDRTVCTPIKVETPKPDYTESLIETLREELEDNHVHWLKLNEILSEQEKTIYDQDDVIVKQNKLIIMGEPKPVPVPKQRTVFDEAHAALWSLESSAKRNGVTPVDIIIKIDPKRIIAETGSLEYGMISINKKNPLSGTAIPKSGEA